MDDVIVVGGRCAGAPLAMLLARAGLNVRVIERSARLGDTLSGHMIKEPGVARLKSWGILDDIIATGCPPIQDGAMWVAGEPVSEAPLAAGSEHSGPSRGPFRALAPRRAALDPVLLDAARQAGAAVEMKTPVRGLLTDGIRVTGVRTDRGEYPARLVIGADGRNSKVARLVSAPKYIDWGTATYAYQAYWKGTALARSYVFLDKGLFIGMFPTNDDLALVFFQAPRAEFEAAKQNPMERYLSALKSQPPAMQLLAGGQPAEPLRGTGDLPTYFRVSVGPGWALTGDAGHHKDPLIARGIADAFRDADLLAAAVARGWDGQLDEALAGYAADRDACAQPISAANETVAAGLGSVPPQVLAQALSTLESLEQALDPVP